MNDETPPTAPVPSSAVQSRTPPWAWLSIVAGYALLGAVGLALAIPPGYASPVFPAAGFALAATLYFGTRVLPAVWLGSFCLNAGVALFQANLSTSTLLVAAGIASGASLQTWAGQWLVRRRLADAWRTLQQEREVLWFLALGGPVACLLAAFCGVSSLSAAGVIEPAEYGYAWWNWYVGDTLGVLLFAPLTLALLQRRLPAWSGRVPTLTSTTLGALFVATIAFLAAAHWEDTDARNDLRRQGVTLADILQHRLTAHDDMVAALARFVEATPDMEPRQFQHFTLDTLRDAPDVFALSFNPYVEKADRAAFEQRMGPVSPGGHYAITERAADGRLVPASERPDYVAVGYIAPLAENLPAVGFDIGSEPKRRNAIERARATGDIAVTEPLTLVQEEQRHVGLLALEPAYDAAGTLLGFAVAVVQVDRMVELAFDGPLPDGLVAHLYDPAADRLLYASGDGKIPVPRGYPWRQRLTMGDRSWELEVFPSQAYLQEQRPWVAWSVGVAGLLCATLLQVLLLSVTGRAAVIRHHVDAQTRQLHAQGHQLRKSEATLRQAQAVAGVGSWELDLASDSLSWSPEAYRLFGVPVGTPLTQQSYVERVHPDDREHVAAAWEAALAGAPYEIDHRIVVDGRTLWVSERAHFTCDDAGRPRHALGTVLDITRTKEMALELEAYRDHLEELVQARTNALTEAQVVLAAAEARYRGLVENDAVGIFVTERDGLRFANATLARLHGFASAQQMVAGSRVEQLVAPTDHERVFAALDETLAGRRCPPLDVTGLCQDGSHIALEVHAVPARWEDRPAAAGLVLDISARKRMEADLARETKRFQMAVEASPVAMLMTDADGRIVLVNPSLEGLLGYTAAELLGSPVEILVPQHARAGHVGLRQAFVADPSSKLMGSGRQIHAVHKDGHAIQVEVGVSQTSDRDRTLTIAAIADVTERNRLMEHMAAARMAAEAANEAKSAFLANMSHEIRTPLHVIAGIASLVKRGGLSPKQADQMAKLESAGRHLVEVIDAILDMSKIEAGKCELRERPFDLVQLVRGVTDLVHERIHAKGLKLVIDIASTHTEFVGDATRLNQALLNFVNNAVKFTDDGTITLGVTMEETADAGALLRFEVTDTGIGIPDEVQSRLFAPFEQADNSSTRAYGGTGLGLVISRKIARMMGGDAGVLSQIGIGSTFWFTARVTATAVRPVETPDGVIAQAGAVLNREHAGRRILVVEDERANREIARLLLQDVGLSVDTAEDGAQALDKVQRAAYDLILMDMQMPRIDGIDATRRIRERSSTRRVPIVAMTANAFVDDRQRCIDAGMDDFLSKPVDPDVLYSTILRWLERSRDDVDVATGPSLHPSPAGKQPNCNYCSGN